MDNRIEERMEEIQQYFNDLEDVRANSEGLAKQESEENLVRKIVSAAIDIGSRIIALEGIRRPDSYAEYFEVLREEDVIDQDLESKLKEMARFRNLIVHQYHKISEGELEEIISDELEDVEEFMKQVSQYYSR